MSEFPRLYDPERPRCENDHCEIDLSDVSNVISNATEVTRFVSFVVGLILFGGVLGSLITMFCLR